MQVIIVKLFGLAPDSLVRWQTSLYSPIEHDIILWERATWTPREIHNGLREHGEIGWLAINT